MKIATVTIVIKQIEKLRRLVVKHTFLFKTVFIKNSREITKSNKTSIREKIKELFYNNILYFIAQIPGLNQAITCQVSGYTMFLKPESRSKISIVATRSL